MVVTQPPGSSSTTTATSKTCKLESPSFPSYSKLQRCKFWEKDKDLGSLQSATNFDLDKSSRLSLLVFKGLVEWPFERVEDVRWRIPTTNVGLRWRVLTFEVVTTRGQNTGVDITLEMDRAKKTFCKLVKYLTAPKNSTALYFVHFLHDSQIAFLIGHVCVLIGIVVASGGLNSPSWLELYGWISR